MHWVRHVKHAVWLSYACHADANFLAHSTSRGFMKLSQTGGQVSLRTLQSIRYLYQVNSLPHWAYSWRLIVPLNPMSYPNECQNQRYSMGLWLFIIKKCVGNANAGIRTKGSFGVEMIVQSQRGMPVLITLPGTPSVPRTVTLWLGVARIPPHQYVWSTCKWYQVQARCLH